MKFITFAESFRNEKDNSERKGDDPKLEMR